MPARVPRNESWPPAVFEDPAPEPMKVLPPPVVLFNPARLPTKVLKLAVGAFGLSLFPLLKPAKYPRNVLSVWFMFELPDP